MKRNIGFFSILILVSIYVNSKMVQKEIKYMDRKIFRQDSLITFKLDSLISFNKNRKVDLQGKSIESVLEDIELMIELAK